MRTFSSLLVVAALVAGPISTATAGDAATATVVIKLPADATVYFDDRPTKQAGAERTYVTPELPPGKEYVYQVKIEYTRDGRMTTQTKSVTVRAGQTSRLEFGEAAAVDAAPRRNLSVK